jgi:hypothetical protein
MFMPLPWSLSSDVGSYTTFARTDAGSDNGKQVGVGQ